VSNQAQQGQGGKRGQGGEGRRAIACLVLGGGQLHELGLPLDHLGLHLVGLLLGAGAEVVDDAQAVLDVLREDGEASVQSQEKDDAEQRVVTKRHQKLQSTETNRKLWNEKFVTRNKHSKRFRREQQAIWRSRDSSTGGRGALRAGEEPTWSICMRIMATSSDSAYWASDDLS
jgi:hypothetical protein